MPDAPESSALASDVWRQEELAGERNRIRWTALVLGVVGALTRASDRFDAIRSKHAGAPVA